MPFIKPEKRKIIDNLKNEYELLYNKKHQNYSVGDICYYFYKKMVDIWKENPRWTTAHNIFKLKNHELQIFYFSKDAKIAYELAWQVFFQKYVMPYENKKEKENGGI